ncbi:molybdenum cofactor guanylyltransferase [Sphingomonas qomolangmaensis]|uniref:Molybdenum cofactor guanylyltransferase n=1 Tax=Sphingomonas qomolangmaensis TaxID=2918765 RepID=A0ABY5L7C6_9SPHN|nr:molybdenum cofactor guanylyltransferase [Sphingomonas qomolangmaensis]UUL81709.1 molybdenum cofactor guanylyltransferase [Sphingomonas qomolangmaensis]
MRLLGAVLAGGLSRRFGSDKAEALLDGERLIDRVVAALTPQVDAVILCGRAPGLPDRPVGGLGPLAGLNAALHHARAHGFDAVLSVPCDAPYLPHDLRAILGDGPAFIADQPVIGIWPAALADRLDVHLRGDDRSLRRWGRATGASARNAPPIANINTPADLSALGLADQSQPAPDEQL